MSRLEELSRELFGEMWDATKEEQDSINNYVESISTKTNLNFYELLDNKTLDKNEDK